MSILIKDMEMPRNCWECGFCKTTTLEVDFCVLNRKQYNWGLEERPSDCPLIEVPLHGRLIDADALLADVRAHSESYFADDFAHEWVDVAPTVIPADKDGET